MASRSMQDWLNEYGESHQNPTNKMIHWVCVPGIFLTVIGFLWAIPRPEVFSVSPWVNWATVTLVGVALFYLRLSVPIALGVVLFSFGCMGAVGWYEQAQLWGLPETCALLFALFWVMQFVGHAIEGKKPSFFQDVQFLLIGPAWVISFIYGKLGIRY